MTFKVGDRIRLTGRQWVNDLPFSDTVTIEDRAHDDALKFVGIEGWWYIEDGGWEAEIAQLSDEAAARLVAFGKSARGPRIGTGGPSVFEQSVSRITTQIAELLIEKNAAYGDSALNPIRVFSKSDRIEQLNVRIDDKISRIQRGSEYGDEDTEMDLIGYLVLRKIARESE